MNLRSVGYERLSALVGQHGAEWLSGQYELRYSEGESNADIARSMGVPWFVLHRWLLENAPESIENAKAARTEWKLDQAERMIEDADTESIGLVKAQTDFALRLAGKRYRKEYGESVKVENTTTVQVDVRGLLTKREGRLIDVIPEVLPPMVIPEVLSQASAQEVEI